MKKLLFILILTAITLNAEPILNLRIVNDKNFIQQERNYSNNSIKLKTFNNKNIKQNVKQQTKIVVNIVKKKKTKTVNKYLLTKNIEIKQLQLQLMELTQKVIKLQKYSELLLNKLNKKERKIVLIKKIVNNKKQNDYKNRKTN